MNHFFFKFFLFFILSKCLLAQNVNLVRFNNSANYTPGSGVSVIINPTGVFQLNNQFILELSDLGGNFGSSPTVLTTLNEFYVPVINGVLPSNLTPGQYKLRVRATLPNTALIAETDFFNVVAGTTIEVSKILSLMLEDGSSTFNCTNCSQQGISFFGQLDASVGANTTSSPFDFDINRTLSICNFNSSQFDYVVRLVNLNNQNVSVLTFNSVGQFLIPTNLPIGTYVIELEKKSSNNISIFSSVFLLHGSATNINNLSSETVCLGNNVAFSIDISLGGIGRNYMGSKYTIDYGDGSPIQTFTQAHLLNIISTSGSVSHVYNDVSCSLGSTPNVGYFIVKMLLYNKGIYNSGNNDNYCNQYYTNGNGTDKRVNTSKAPIANFDLPLKQCIGNSITAINTTILGQYGTAECLNIPLYFWAVKRPNDTDFISINAAFNPTWIQGNNLVIPASAVAIPGCWQIRLQARNGSGAGCTAITEMIKTIKIEATPNPTFSNTPASPICAGTTVFFTNTSNVNSLICQEHTYQWLVTPVTGTPATTSGFQFINPTNTSTVNANILFTQPGTYEVVLKITNSCGTFDSAPRSIVVFGDPSVSFNPNTLTVCDETPAGHTLDFSVDSIKPTYSIAPFAPTSYSWSISGVGVTSADYSFVGGTNANSQFPQINFTAFKTYLITVLVNGNCSGTNQATFTFVLKEQPKITNTNLNQIICTGGSTVPISLTSNMASGTTYNWTATASNGITGFPVSGNLATIPALTPNNPSSSTGTITFTVIPFNNGCEGSPVNFTIIVNPSPSIPNQSLSVCSSQSFNLNLTNNPPNTILPIGTTFTWTVNAPTGISGASNQTNPTTSISQNLTNNTNQTLLVTYNITASNGTAPNICSDDFILTVSVNPKPLVPNQSLSICSGEAFNLNFTNNPPTIILPAGTQYTWTVVSPSGISGASNQSTPVNNVSQILNNNSNNPLVANYIITAISGNCNSTFPLVVTVNPEPNATISGDASTCLNNGNLSVVFTGSNGTPPYTFNYTINGGAVQSITTTSGNSATVMAPTNSLGTFTYCLVGVTDSSSSICNKVLNSCSTITVNPLPTISTQPLATQNICVGGSVPAFTVAYTGGVGTPTYQWFSNTSNSNTGGVAISGATQSSYTPPVFNSVGTFYYYAQVTLSGSGCGSTTSEVAMVEVVADPVVSQQAIATQTLCQNSVPTDLSVTVTGGIGTYTYQWYSNTTNNTTTGTAIAGANQSVYTPPTTTVGTTYYYVVIGQSGIGCGVTSAVSQVVVVAAPTITTQPLSSSVCEGGVPTLLTVAFTNGTGTPTYQWYSNTSNSNSGGTAISGATNNSFAPPSNTVGTTYYYHQQQLCTTI